jgi:hypothetical protein
MCVRYYSACHGAHGRSDAPVAPAFQPPPADLTRMTQRHDGRFPVAEIIAASDGRTVIPAHGSREIPIWDARCGEMAGGGALLAGLWSRTCSVCASTLSKASRNNITQPYTRPLSARGAPGAWCPWR